jgi:hypothetical protein
VIVSGGVKRWMKSERGGLQRRIERLVFFISTSACQQARSQSCLQGKDECPRRAIEPYKTQCRGWVEQSRKVSDGDAYTDVASLPGRWVQLSNATTKESDSPRQLRGRSSR